MPLLEQVLDAPGLFAELPVAATRILTDAGQNGVHGVRLELRGDGATWATIQARGLFHYSPAICGPIFGGAFRDDLPYWITIELAEPHASAVAALALDPASAWRVVAEASSDALLRRPAAWVLLSVMQPRTPNVQWGMTTSFFREEAK